MFALSVTCNSKAYVSPAVSVLPATVQVTVAPPEAPVPLLTAHWVVVTYEPPFTETTQDQAYGAIPVVGIVPVTVKAWSTSSAVALTVGVAGGVNTGANVTLTPRGAPLTVKLGG